MFAYLGLEETQIMYYYVQRPAGGDPLHHPVL